MKRMLAVVLALLALLGPVARAQTRASVARLQDLTITHVEGKKSRSARFTGATLTLSTGNPDGAPTLQINFESASGQAVDGVARLDGQEILLAVGGISGVYYIDLAELAGDSVSTDELADGLKRSLSLVNENLDLVLYAVTEEGAKGMRSVEIPLPMSQLIEATEMLLLFTGATDTGQDMDIDSFYERVDSMGDEAVLSFRYNPKSGAFELAAIQSGKAVRLSGNMQLTIEDMDFIEINPEEDRYDALHLSPLTLLGMQGELNIILMKIADYADGTGLNKIMR